MRRLVGLVLALVACQTSPPSQRPAVVELVSQLRQRSSPASAQARCRIHLRSPLLDVAGSAACGLRVEGDGRGHLALFGPMGGQAASFNADGRGFSLSVARDNTHLVAEDADLWMRAATHDVCGLAELFGLLVGDVPLDSSPIGAHQVLADLVRAEIEGPLDVVVAVVADLESGTLTRIEARDPHHGLLFVSRYSDWSTVGDFALPGGVSLQVPWLDLDVELRAEEWTLPTSAGVYDLSAPDGYVTRDVVDLLRRESAP